MLQYFEQYYFDLYRGYHYFIKEILFIVGIVLLNFVLPRWKKTDKKWLLLLEGLGFSILVWVAMVIPSSFCDTYLGRGSQYGYVYPLVSIFFSFILSKDRMVERLILSFSFFIIFMYTVRSVDTFSYILAGTKDYIKGDPLSIKVDALRCLASTLLISGEIVVLHYFNTRKCKTIDTRGAVILPIIYFIIYWYQSFSSKGEWLDNAIANTLLLVVLYLIYVMYYLATKEYNKMLEYQVVASQNQQKLEQIQLLNTSYDDFRKIRHDIKNQYAIMGTLLEKKDYGQLEQVFASFNNQILNAVKYYDCGNEIINPVLNIEASKARNKNIKTDFKAVVPAHLRMEDSDLISLLSNLLDNAIEAVERYQKLEMPIELKIMENNGNLFITVSNYVEEELDVNSLMTKKKDKDAHGYGVRIVKNIVNKYDGYVKFSSENHRFTADVYLPLKGRE